MLLRNCIIGGVLGMIVGFSTPKVYVTDSELAAEMQEEGALEGRAASLASLAGINLGTSSDAIGPNLYPNVVASNYFIVGLLNTPVRTLDGDFKGSYMEYLSKNQKIAWWNYPKVWLSRAMKAVIGSSGKKSMVKDGIDPQQLTEDEEVVVSGVRRMIQCSVNELDGTISIRASAQDPVVAKIMVEAAIVRLQAFITSYRTNKARLDLKYYEDLEKQALDDYRKAQSIYADFCDSHREINLQSYLNKKENLANDMQLAFSSYSSMKQQVQVAKAKVQENTPAFTVVKAASVPVLADSPKKKLIVAGLVFVSFIATLGWIYFRLLFSNKDGEENQRQVNQTRKPEQAPSSEA